MIKKLEEGFRQIKEYCTNHELIINTAKTLFIVFKPKGMKLPVECQLSLDGCPILPSPSVTLLGVILDQHLTMGKHIDEVVKKYHGLLGVLRRAAPFLVCDLLLLAYTFLIRCHLEYCSSVFAAASKTQLQKLDRVQRIAARLICGVPADAHSVPLLAELKLKTLEERRDIHVLKIIKDILNNDCHPATRGMFQFSSDGGIGNSATARTALGRSRFSIRGKEKYNSYLVTD